MGKQGTRRDAKSQQDAEKVRQLCSRIAQRLNVPLRVRLTSSLAAAALDGHFEHPASYS
jgi:RNase H-fold protein (predicted Holliday junction resolvase)